MLSVYDAIDNASPTAIVIAIAAVLAAWALVAWFVIPELER